MSAARTKRTSNSQVVENPVTYNILLAGESGTGKSAVINMIFDSSHVITSSDAVGCTKKCTSVRDSPKDYADINLRMVDTVGLSESLEGSVPNKKAIAMFEDKLNSLYSKDGIHLILYCIRKGRQLKPTIEHYQTVVHDLCEGKVPCLLVITRCENDAPIGKWWKENENTLRNEFKMDVNDAVTVTAIKTDETLVEYNESRKRLIEAIKNNVLKKPWRFENLKEKLTSLFHRNNHSTAGSRKTTSDPLWDHLQRPMNAPTLTQSIWSWFTRSS